MSITLLFLRQHSYNFFPQIFSYHPDNTKHSKKFFEIFLRVSTYPIECLPYPHTYHSIWCAFFKAYEKIYKPSYVHYKHLLGTYSVAITLRPDLLGWSTDTVKQNTGSPRNQWYIQPQFLRINMFSISILNLISICLTSVCCT
jgi:hypothetical protein